MPKRKTFKEQLTQQAKPAELPEPMRQAVAAISRTFQATAKSVGVVRSKARAAAPAAAVCLGSIEARAQAIAADLSQLATRGPVESAPAVTETVAVCAACWLPPTACDCNGTPDPDAKQTSTVRN